MALTTSFWEVSHLCSTPPGPAWKTTQKPLGTTGEMEQNSFASRSTKRHFKRQDTFTLGDCQGGQRNGGGGVMGAKMRTHRCVQGMCGGLWGLLMVDVQRRP